MHCAPPFGGRDIVVRVIAEGMSRETVRALDLFIRMHREEPGSESHEEVLAGFGDVALPLDAERTAFARLREKYLAKVATRPIL